MYISKQQKFNLTKYTNTEILAEDQQHPKFSSGLISNFDRLTKFLDFVFSVTFLVTLNAIKDNN